MNAGLKLLVSILVVSCSLPIWYYLLYQILVRVQATELMFFLFWIYVPVGFVAAVLNQAIVNNKS